MVISHKSTGNKFRPVRRRTLWNPRKGKNNKTVTTKPLQLQSVICYDIFRITLVHIKHHEDGRPIQTVDTGIIQVSVRLCRIDWRRPNIVTSADSSSPDQHSHQKHPAVTMMPFTRFTGRRVFVSELCIACKVSTTTVDNVIGGAANAPVKVLPKDRLHYLVILCTMKQLSFNHL